MAKKTNESPIIDFDNVVASPDEIAENFAVYTEPSTEREPFLDEYAKEESEPSPTPDDPVQEIEWRNNPLYFQTGKKAGQLRPTGNKLNVAYRKDNSQSTISGDIISGALFLTLIDLLLPFIFIKANNYFSKDKLKMSDLEMTEKQKRTLEPIADKVAAQIKATANPTVILVFTLCSIYAINFAEAKFLKKMKKDGDE
jgi:hypothetical protein